MHLSILIDQEILPTTLTITRFLSVYKMVGALKVLFLRRLFSTERILREHTNPLDMYTVVEMIKRYRFPRDKLLELIDHVSRIKYRHTRRRCQFPTACRYSIKCDSKYI